MRPRVLPVLLVLALVLPAALAADPGRRSQDLSTAAVVNDVAVSDAGTRIAAAVEDAGSNGIGQNPNQDVWYLWDEDGAVIQHGSADRANCATTLGDSCQSDGKLIAMSDDGTRLVVLAQVARPTTGSSQEALLLFITSNAGEGHRLLLPGQPRGLAISANGAHVAAVTEEQPAGTATERDTRAFAYDWGTQFAVTEVFTDTLPNPPADMAMSRDGQRILVATNPGSGAGQTHWYARSEVQTDASVTGLRPTTVAIAGQAPYRATVGYGSGDLLLFNDGSKQTTTSRLQYGGGATAVTEVTIARSGLQAAAGYSDGHIRLFSIDASNERLSRFGTDQRPTNGAIGHLAYSGDGAYLAAASGETLALYSVSAGGLTEVWKTSLASPVAAIALNATGDLLAAASGSSVALFDAKRTLSAAAQGATPNVQPGARFERDARFENTGNRPLNVALSLGFPAGWFVEASPLQFSLAPGESRTVKVTGLVPESAAPGAYDVFLNHSRGQARVPVTVPLVRDLVVDVPEGPGIAVGSDGSATRQVVVANRGNRAETVRPVLQATNGWSASATPSELSVAPGDDGEFQVRVSAPEGAQQGDSTTVTLTLAGQSTAPTRLTATIGAIFGVDLSGPAGLEVPAGGNRSASYTLRNPGNTLDAYEVEVSGSFPQGWSVAFADGSRYLEVDELAAGGSVPVTVHVTAPFAADLDQSFTITVTATSVGADGQSETQNTIVSVGSATTASTTDKGGKGTPGPGLAVGLLALAAAMWLQRRR